MAAVDAGDVIRIACKMSYDTDGQDLINVMYLRALSQTASLLSTIQAEIGSAIEKVFDGVRLQTSNILKYVTLDVKNITQDTLVGEFAWPTFVQGAVAGAPASPQVAALLTMPTIKSRVQGRVYFAGTPENAIGDGVLDATQLAAILTTGTVMLFVITEPNSSYEYIVFNTTLGTFTSPASAVVITPTRTQRRRSHGIGS